jgi:hypothetical protein
MTKELVYCAREFLKAKQLNLKKELSENRARCDSIFNEIQRVDSRLTFLDVGDLTFSQYVDDRPNELM